MAAPAHVGPFTSAQEELEVQVRALDRLQAPIVRRFAADLAHYAAAGGTGEFLRESEDDLTEQEGYGTLGHLYGWLRTVPGARDVLPRLLGATGQPVPARALSDTDVSMLRAALLDYERPWAFAESAAPAAGMRPAVMAFNRAFRAAVDEQWHLMSDAQFRKLTAFSRASFGRLVATLTPLIVTALRSNRYSIEPCHMVRTTLVYLRCGECPGLGTSCARFHRVKGLDRCLDGARPVAETRLPSVVLSANTLRRPVHAGCKKPDPIAKLCGIGRTSVYTVVGKVLNAVIDTPGLLTAFWDEPGWQARSAMAFSHFVGSCNIALAVDGFTISVQPATGVTADEKQRYYKQREGPKLAVGVAVDAFRMVRLLFGGEPASVHDSVLFRATEAHRVIHSEEALGPNLVVIGDLAYARTARVVVKLSSPIPQPGLGLWQQRGYTTVLDRGRQVVEMTIGDLRKMFPLAFVGARIDEPRARKLLLLGVWLYNFRRADQLQHEGDTVPIKRLLERLRRGRGSSVVDLGPADGGGLGDLTSGRATQLKLAQAWSKHAGIVCIVNSDRSIAATTTDRPLTEADILLRRVMEREHALLGLGHSPAEAAEMAFNLADAGLRATEADIAMAATVYDPVM